MRKTISTLLLASGAVLVASGAFAADLSRPVYTKAPMAPQAFSWTGFYVGAHIGYGWGDTDWSAGNATTTETSKGIIGGGQAGYNWQIAPTWVLGVEGDISGSGITSNTCNGICNADINWLATVTGRVGYTFDRTMIYAKGGLAVMNQDLNVAIFKSNDTRAGWTVGAGLEYAFAPAWSAKIEYNYMDFGSTTTALPRIEVDQTVNTVKMGVNYKFGGL